jgi:outer membrane protein assembly factor BamB
VRTRSLLDPDKMRFWGFGLVFFVAIGDCKTNSSTFDAGGAGGAGASGGTIGRASSSGASADTAVKTGFLKCIEDWPTSGGPHSLKPSLKVEAPNLLWKKTVAGFKPGYVDDAGPVLSKDRLAFHAGKWVYFLNKDGTNPQTLYVEGCPSGLVADEQGNVYYTSDAAVVSLDASGNARWQTATSGLAAGQLPSGPGEGCRFGLTPVLAPDGVLYATTYDEMLRAIRTSDGKVLWSLATGNTSRVMGGGGKAVFVAYGQRHTDALDTRDGQVLGSFVDPAYGQSFVWGWGAWTMAWDLQISFGNMLVFDSCGKLRWTGEPKGAGVVVPGELFAISDNLQVGTLSLFDLTGKVVVGPSPAEGWAMAAGADGTIYTYRSQAGTFPAINRLLAYSPELKELWRIEFTAQESLGINGNIILDEDGVLYLSRPDITSGTEILAIQTRSPGLADSSWPSFRHDNRGTAWLVPGTPANSTPPDAARSDAIDAPVGLGTRD